MGTISIRNYVIPAENIDFLHKAGRHRLTVHMKSGKELTFYELSTEELVELENKLDSEYSCMP